MCGETLPQKAEHALYGAKTLILLTQTTHFDFDISRFCSLTIN